MSDKQSTPTAPRLKAAFFTQGVKILQEKLGTKNINAVPKLVKIVLNIGVSAARENIKADSLDF